MQQIRFTSHDVQKYLSALDTTNAVGPGVMFKICALQLFLVLLVAVMEQLVKRDKLLNCYE